MSTPSASRMKTKKQRALKSDTQFCEICLKLLSITIKPKEVCVHLHTALRFLDGVMQQTLESTLKRPALLHKGLVTADTPKV